MNPMLMLSAAILASLTCLSLGGEPASSSMEPVEKVEENSWECSIDVSTYLVQHGRDYASPTLSADRGWLHLETRYNYESLKTGSFWVGYNFGFGDKLSVEATPMFGGVFGDATGIAPGYALSASYGPIEFFTQGEYFIDTGTSSGNFFYNWSE